MPVIVAKKPVLGIAAFSGTGKTTLLTRLLPLLGARGLRVGMIKHAHHSFEIDTPGKDSYELRKAGAAQMLIASARRWALMVDHEHRGEPRLAQALARLDQDSLDLILVEGFKTEPIPKIELHRPCLGKPAMYPGDDTVVAVATDGDLPVVTELPVLDINDVEAIAGFVLQWLARQREKAPAS
jgi:molybdopterin-guanine dinucleotide biosynthesis protein MobB